MIFILLVPEVGKNVNEFVFRLAYGLFDVAEVNGMLPISFSFAETVIEHDLECRAAMEISTVHSSEVTAFGVENEIVLLFPVMLSKRSRPELRGETSFFS